MGGNSKEACGRCGMTGVVEMTDDGTGDRDPFEGGHIEVSADELRTVLFPIVWLSRVKRRVDDLAMRLTYGRSD